MKFKLLAAILLTASTFAYAGCYSEGVRVGTVQKFSVKGFVNKSWEGELVMEGTKVSTQGNSTRGGNVWKFSVTDKQVAATVEDAVMSGKPVALKYCQGVFTFGQTDTTYEITKAVLR